MLVVVFGYCYYLSGGPILCWFFGLGVAVAAFYRFLFFGGRKDRFFIKSYFRRRAIVLVVFCLCKCCLN